MPLATIPEAIEEIRAGRPILVVDDEDRENEGDLLCAAEKVTPEIINFMAAHGRGLICLPIIGQRLDELGIPLMVRGPFNSSPNQTAFTVSIDARSNTSSGISSQDRAETIRAVLDPQTRPQDVAMPGHIFPLRAKEGGVLVRAGHTEAAVDLARMAGLYPAGVICEVMNEDGTMARRPQLESFAARWNLKTIAIRDLIAYRHQHEKLVAWVAEAELPTRYGDFRIIAFRSTVDANEHVALVKGDLRTDEPVLVRVHTQCIAGDIFASQVCSCGEEIALALQAIAAEGRGVLVYMRQEGPDMGLHIPSHIKAPPHEPPAPPGSLPELRQHGIGAQILLELGLKKIRVLTDNPKRAVGLEGYGLSIVEQRPLTPQGASRGREPGQDVAI